MNPSIASLYLILCLTATITTVVLSVSTTSQTVVPSKEIKERASLKLDKVHKVAGGWIEFRQAMTDGKYIYACSSAATLSKFDMETEKHIKTVYVEGGIERSLACTYSNGFIYTLGRKADDKELPTVLWRYNASDMTPAGEPLEIPGEKVRAWQMTSNDDYLFLPILSEPARVLRIKLNPFQHDLTITFARGENYASAITFDDTREHIYVAVHNPALIKKISADTLEEVDTAELNYTQDNGYVRMDQDGQFIYCAVTNGFSAVVKVDMDTMEVVAMSQAGERHMGNGVVVSDRGAGLVHVGNIDMPFKWSKVDATAGDDGEDMENLGVEVSFEEQEPANRMKHALIIRDRVWVANGRGKFLTFKGIVSGGPLATTFNNKYSGEPFDTTKLEVEEEEEEEREGEGEGEKSEEKKIEIENTNNKKQKQDSNNADL